MSMAVGWWLVRVFGGVVPRTCPWGVGSVVRIAGRGPGSRGRSGRMWGVPPVAVGG